MFFAAIVIYYDVRIIVWGGTVVISDTEVLGKVLNFFIFLFYVDLLLLILYFVLDF